MAMAFDYLRTDVTYSLRVALHDPKTGAVRGELQGVSGGKLTLDYYSDTKASATVETVSTGSDGWDGTAAMRLHFDVSDSMGERVWGDTLFTGFVKGVDEQRRDGMYVRKYELGSKLWTLQNDLMGILYMDAGLSVQAAITHILKDTGGAIYEVGCPDAALRAQRIIEPGTSRLSALYDLADAAGIQVSVTQGGDISLGRYVEPSRRGADFDANASASRGDVIEPIKVSDATLGLYSGYMVVSKKNDRYAYGTAERTSGRASAAARGYRYMGKESINDLAPFSNAAAATEARKLLNRDTAVAEMSHGLLFKPLRVGMIERFWQASKSTRWLVKSANLDMNPGLWTWDVDLKGGWA